jgi:hypothetical protein
MKANVASLVFGEEVGDSPNLCLKGMNEEGDTDEVAGEIARLEARLRELRKRGTAKKSSGASLAALIARELRS